MGVDLAYQMKDKPEYYMDGYLYKLLEGLRKAVYEKNTSAVIITDGRSGMGKTTLCNQIGSFLDPNYSLDKVFYEPQKFLDYLSIAKAGDFILFDEAMLLSSRSALSEINRMVVQAMSMIRSKQLFVCFAVNSIFDLDRNLALSRADLLLHVYGDNLTDRGHFAAFFKPKGHECKIKLLYLLGKKFYSYNKPKANFYGRFYSKFILDPIAYEKQKQEGVNNFLKGSAKRENRRTRYLKNLLKYVKDELKTPINDICEIMPCSIQTIYNILDLESEKQNK